MREETKYIVVHCSQTRPSQDIGAKDIDRWHREREIQSASVILIETKVYSEDQTTKWSNQNDSS